MSAIAFDLPELARAAREGVLRFIDAEVKPRLEKNHALLTDPRLTYAEDGRYAPRVRELIRDVRMASSKAGFYAMCAPPEIGGGGLGYVAYYAAWEAAYRACGGHSVLTPWIIAHWAFGPSPVLLQATERARAEALEGLVSGETSMCFGLSEPAAGSDATMIKTKAIQDGTGWRISGRKLWTTNSPTAEWCILFAVTDPDRAARKAGGISAFLVPTDAPGFTLESVVKMHGHVGGHEGALVFEDLKVEPWQVVGPLHDGFRIAMLGVSLGRVYNAARAVGQARWALEKAFDYANQRVAFGKPIAEHQGVAFPLAAAATEVHGAHLMGLNAATLLDAGHRAIKELSMAKAYAVQVGLRAIDAAIQTHGGIGLTNEVGLTHAWQDIRAVNIADGTNEILNRTIAQRLFGGDVDL